MPWYTLMYGAMAFTAVCLWAKPDTDIKVWAREEALLRRARVLKEAEA
jgi:hypothetical protein